jgi:Flp pilus assembly protein TadG
MFRFGKFIEETRGATLVEFSFIAPLLFLITFAIVEIGYFLFQYQALDASTRIAARMAATRGPVITGMPDCGVNVSTSPGNYCDAAGVSSSWSATCTGLTLTTTGGAVAGACDSAIMNRILQEMQLVYPTLTVNNLMITYSRSDLGFVGKGRPVPLVTAEVTGVNAALPVLSAFGIGPFPMPSFSTSLPGEDLSGL